MWHNFRWADSRHTWFILGTNFLSLQTHSVWLKKTINATTCCNDEAHNVSRRIGLWCFASFIFFKLQPFFVASQTVFLSLKPKSWIQNSDSVIFMLVMFAIDSGCCPTFAELVTDGVFLFIAATVGLFTGKLWKWTGVYLLKGFCASRSHAKPTSVAVFLGFPALFNWSLVIFR